MKISNAPIVRAHFRIRRPIADVFEAFVNPEITSKFWFSRSSGRLESGATVTWHWDAVSASTEVRVLEIEPDKRILFEWGIETENPSQVEWTFTAQDDATTLVEVVNSGFIGDDEQVVAHALDSTSGFTLVLAAAKAWLEHGIDLKIVADRV